MASDNFNRANETPLAAPWVKANTAGLTVNLASNQIVSAGTGTDTFYYYAGSALSPDQFSQMTVVPAPGAGTDDFGPAVRINGNGHAGVAEGYFWDVTSGAGLFQYTNGVITQLTSNSPSHSAGDVIRLEATGTNPVVVKGYKNGVLLDSFSDSSASRITGAGNGVGFFHFNMGGGDNWSGGDLFPAVPISSVLLMRLNMMRGLRGPRLIANPGLVFLSAAGQTVLLGTVTEIEAALALAKLKVQAFQLNSETDAALTLAVRKARLLAQATETDTNLAFGKFKVKTLPVNTEADSAISLPGRKVKALTLATETDAAIAFTRFKSRILGIVSEVDAAIAFGRFKVKAFTLASETDTAVPFTRVKTRLLAVATEADSALAFTKKKVKALGVITETDLALAITRLISGQSAALATVLETDAVLAFVRLKRKALGQATETDTSVPLAGRKVKAVTLATEADSTFAVGRQKARTLTPATTVTAALPFVLRKIKQITQVTESDSAIAIIRKVLSVVVNPRATFSGTGPSAGVVSTGSHATVVVDDAVTAEFSADPTANTVGDQ